MKQLAELGGTWNDVEPLIEKVRNTPLTFREQADTTEGVPLGVHAINPVNGERVPCFVAPYVLMEYGTGAIMAVPGARRARLRVRARARPADPRGDPAGGGDPRPRGDGPRPIRARA